MTGKGKVGIRKQLLHSHALLSLKGTWRDRGDAHKFNAQG